MTTPDAAVELAALYRFHMFDLARELSRLQKLRCLYTGTPRGYARLPRRNVKVRSAGVAVRYAIGRAWPTHEYAALRWVIRDFDAWVKRSMSGAPIVMAMSAHASETLKAAKLAGSRVICDRGSWHILESERTLTEEYARWGIPPPEFDLWGVDRELSDYDVADCIFVPSTTARDSFVRQGIAATRLSVIPYGADLEEFSVSLERDHLRVISVGNISLRKGHPHLHRAYSAVRGPGTSLIMIGTVDAEVEPLLAPAPDIALPGRLDRRQVASYLRTSGIFVLASVEEGLPLSLLQAMASGLPIIATRATGAADVITDGREGFLIDDPASPALPNAIQRLFDDRQLSQSMGLAARARAESFGGWRAYGESVDARMSELIAQ